MRNLLACLFAILLCCELALAQTGAGSSDADHEALRSLKANVATAIKERNPDKLASLMTDEFVFTAVDQTRVVDRKQLKVLFEKWFAGAGAPFDSIEIEPAPETLTKFISPDAGYCYGVSKETYKFKNGDIARMDSKWTVLVARQNGEWKIAAAHVGVDFLTKPIKMEYASAWRRILSWVGLA